MTYICLYVPQYQHRWQELSVKYVFTDYMINANISLNVLYTTGRGNKFREIRKKKKYDFQFRTVPWKIISQRFAHNNNGLPQENLRYWKLGTSFCQPTQRQNLRRRFDNSIPYCREVTTVSGLMLFTCLEISLDSRTLRLKGALGEPYE